MDLMELKMELTDRKITDHKTAILLGPDDLLRQAIEPLIREAKDWEVIGIWDEHSVDDLIRDIDCRKPDVAVIVRGGLMGGKDLPMRLMEMYPDLTIVTLGLESNQVDVYNKQKISVSDASDLVSIINQSAYKFKTRKETKK